MCHWMIGLVNCAGIWRLSLCWYEWVFCFALLGCDTDSDVWNYTYTMHTYIYTPTHMHTLMHMHTHAHTCMHTHTHACAYTFAVTHTCTFTITQSHTHIYICTHTRAHTHTHTHTCRYAHVSSSQALEKSPKFHVQDLEIGVWGPLASLNRLH